MGLGFGVRLVVRLWGGVGGWGVWLGLGVVLDRDLEDAHEEEVVQPLVGVVDAQLLEGKGEG